MTATRGPRQRRRKGSPLDWVEPTARCAGDEDPAWVTHPQYLDRATKTRLGAICSGCPIRLACFDHHQRDPHFEGYAGDAAWPASSPFATGANVSPVRRMVGQESRVFVPCHGCGRERQAHRGYLPTDLCRMCQGKVLVPCPLCDGKFKRLGIAAHVWQAHGVRLGEVGAS